MLMLLFCGYSFSVHLPFSLFLSLSLLDVRKTSVSVTCKKKSDKLTERNSATRNGAELRTIDR